MVDVKIGVHPMLAGNVLITGGTGTLGRAIIDWTRKNHQNCNFTIYSRSELRQAQMRSEYSTLRGDIRYVLGDVRDAAQLAAAVVGHDIVVHAAALKRIPECEDNPEECYKTNVQGSTNVIRACQQGGVSRCVGISTDKACAAITTYGATKRLMEGLFQRAEGPTIFTLVRYGNVVGSNGSVIPLWRHQVKQGHPLTLTGGEMTRFWMSESQAVRTIDRALRMPGGTITVPKMGALTLRHMAEIIAPGAETVEVGVRSLEKTHEDLIHPDEGAMDDGMFFTLRPELRSSGIAYSSDTAPVLSPTAFLSMISGEI